MILNWLIVYHQNYIEPISIYILGIKDKKYLALNFGNKIGKAKVTGYCIKFKSLIDINTQVLQDAILFGLEDSVKS